MTDEQVEEVYQFWLNGAEDAYQTAELIFNGGHYTHALFFCHLTIEKMLKAFVIRNTKTHAPYEHNLAELWKLSGLDMTKEPANVLDEINSFNIKGRYSDYKLAFYKKANKEYANKYLNETTKLYSWLKSQTTQ